MEMFCQSSTVLVICALASVSCEYQKMKLIGGLNKFFDFDHNILLVDTAVDIDPFINKTESTPRSIFSLQGNFSTNWRIKSKNTFVIVILANGQFNETFRSLQWLKGQFVQVKIKIGIFFPESALIEHVQELFEWCKVNLILDIFATIYFNQNLNIFTYNPFGPVVKVNLTSSTYDNYYTTRKSNYKLLKVDRVPTISRSIFWPTFFYIDELYMKFRKNHTINDPEYGIKIIPAVIFAEIDKRVYPIAMLPLVIVVPQSLPYSDFTAYLQTITTDTFFGYSLITVGVVILLLTMFRYIKQKKIRFFQSVTDVLNLLINDNGYISYQRLSLSECYLIVPLTFVGLVFVNGILSNLQSYLTDPVYEPQMKSVEEIYGLAHLATIAIYLRIRNLKL